MTAFFDHAATATWRKAAARAACSGVLLALMTTLPACSWKETQVADTTSTAPSPVIDHEVETLAGEKIQLSSYRGKALLIVNTASQCGLTPQYAGLQELYSKYKDRGFEILAFPCNDFGAQEPGTADEIKGFCSAKFNVTFPLFAKVQAKAPKSPLYKTLTEDLPAPLAGEIKWNFTKFLVSPDGKVVARFEPMVEPMSPEVTAQIEKVLPPPAM